MCFSAQASFISAAGLSIIGLLSIKKTRETKMIPLAATPFIFALQQACEGIVWVTLQSGTTTTVLHKIGLYGFLFFAGTWWPIWIPLVTHIPEKIPIRKKLLAALFFLGIIIGIILFFEWTLQTTGAEIVNNHLNYPVENYPFSLHDHFWDCILMYTFGIMYSIAIIAPLFVSSIRYMWLLGVVISIWLGFTYFVYTITFPSVWCFFAALSSIIVYFIV